MRGLKIVRVPWVRTVKIWPSRYHLYHNFKRLCNVYNIYLYFKLIQVITGNEGATCTYRQLTKANPNKLFHSCLLQN